MNQHRTVNADLLLEPFKGNGTLTYELHTVPNERGTADGTLANSSGLRLPLDFVGEVDMTFRERNELHVTAEGNVVGTGNTGYSEFAVQAWARDYLDRTDVQFI